MRVCMRLVRHLTMDDFNKYQKSGFCATPVTECVCHSFWDGRTDERTIEYDCACERCDDKREQICLTAS